MRGRYLVAVALLLACSVAVAGEVPDPFAQITNVHFAFYDVEGASIAEIKASIAERGPRDPNDFGKMTGRTDWYVVYQWGKDPDGKCSPALATARFEAFVILPRLASSVAPEVEDKWNVFLSKLRQHEANHARHAYEHMPNLLAAARSAPSCEAALGTLAPVVEALRKYDVDYDAATDHGRTEGAILD